MLIARRSKSKFQNNFRTASARRPSSIRAAFIGIATFGPQVTIQQESTASVRRPFCSQNLIGGKAGDVLTGDRASTASAVVASVLIASASSLLEGLRRRSAVNQKPAGS
jgi:hypothetical protein